MGCNVQHYKLFLLFFVFLTFKLQLNTALA